MIRDALPPRLVRAHARRHRLRRALRGKRVAVLGAGASAFDNAATALEHGAREVRLFFRRQQLVNVNAYRWAEFVGFLQAPRRSARRRQVALHPARSCAWASCRRPTPSSARGSTPAFTCTPAASWRRRSHARRQCRDRRRGRRTLRGRLRDRRHRLRHRSAPCARSCASVEPHIARWADRYQPPEDERHEDLARHPVSRARASSSPSASPGRAPYLRYLYNYTFGGLLSLGFGGASISGMKYSIPRLVAGITRSLFVEDREAHFASLCGFAEPEF